MTTARSRFRALHESGCFVIPNPWNEGSAVILRELGFAALASTSAGFAFTHARPDTPTSLSCDEVLDHLRILVRATDLPVNADFQNGYGETATEVAHQVTRCVQTGVAGLSIEDATGDPGTPLYERAEAVERVAAARAAIDAEGADVLLTARAECFLVGHEAPLRESIERLQAFIEVGADVVYTPGLRDLETIRTVVAEVGPTPVNVLLNGQAGLRLSDVAAVGVRRVSVGSAMARAAWTAFVNAAQQIQTEGTFDALAETLPISQFNEWFT